MFVKLCLDSSYKVQNSFISTIFFFAFKTLRILLSEISQEKIRDSFQFDEIFCCFSKHCEFSFFSENVDAIGVDVMSLEDKRFSSAEKIQEFFRLMTRQFTAEEWMQIKDQQLDLNAQLANFFRFWTLKESFVKGHGHGLGWNLQRLSFKVNPAEKASLVVGQISDNSQLYLDGELAEQWYFAETLLDAQHCVATATKGLKGSSSYHNKSLFSLVTPQTILDSLEPLEDRISDNEFNSDYLNKIEVKPF